MWLWVRQKSSAKLLSPAKRTCFPLLLLMFPWLIPSSFSPPASLTSQSQDKYYLRDFKALLVLLSFTITTGPWNQDPELGGPGAGERGSCVDERAHGRPGPSTPHPPGGRFPRLAASPPHTKQPCRRLWLSPHGDSALWRMGTRLSGTINHTGTK